MSGGADPDTARRSGSREERRHAILRALAEAVREEGIHAFSVQKVADRAGLSHRTVYRYFPTRDDLLEGLVEFAEAAGGERPEGPSFSVATLPEDTARLFETFEQAPALTEAAAVGALALTTRAKRRAARDRAETDRIEAAMPRDPRVSSREAAAVLRYLTDSLAWVVLRRQLGLDEEEARRAILWATETLLADVKANAAGG